MVIPVIKRTQCLVLGLFLSFTVAAETIESVQQQLKSLEQQYQQTTSSIETQKSQLPALSASVKESQKLLSERNSELKSAGEKMKAAIGLSFSAPSAEKEREAHKLSREFTLTELAASRQQLALERAERDYSNAVAEIKLLGEKQESIKKNIHALQEQMVQVMAKETATKIQSQQQDSAPVKAPEPNNSKPVVAKSDEEATPPTATQEKETQPEQPAAPPSIEEQKRNIQRVINDSGWSGSRW